MTSPTPVSFETTDLDAIAGIEGRVAVIVGSDGKLGREARRINRLTKGALNRLIEAKAFADMKPGRVTTLAWPVGMAAEALDVLKLDRRCPPVDARKAGVALGKVRGSADMLLLAGASNHPAEIALGIALRGYSFDDHKTKTGDAPKAGSLRVSCSKPDEAGAEYAPKAAVAEGVFFTRDLVSEPANVLTTTEFANRLKEMEALGLTVKVMEEDELQKLGMGALLCVGHGSDSPSKVVVMEWNGGKKGDAPFALVGKGVVFDTGGISLKPAAGMEDMTMDMGGAGVVSGVMKTLALRKAKANVVGLVGLVENMPSARATRPGDIVKSMKGDTIEVINTDAEGRLVLCDVLWYAQETYQPTGIINLATLTGAMIIALGHETAGAFSNDDALCNAFLKAADAEGEAAWRMPMGQVYDDMLKSNLADMKNVGGRPAGSITAAQFLKRFIKDGTPWIHLDIAGVALTKTDSPYAGKGASGWGVMALDRLIADKYEAE